MNASKLAQRVRDLMPDLEAVERLLEEELEAAHEDGREAAAEVAVIPYDALLARLNYLRTGGMWQVEGGYIEGFINAMKIFGVKP